MNTVIFELSKPLKYANGSGNEVEATHIELQEPTVKVSSYCCNIESLIQSGIIKMSDVLGDDVIEEAKQIAQEKEDKTPDPSSILSVMFSGDIDMNKLVVNFRELFKEVALMGGEKKLTIPRMDEMSYKDFKEMMGVYTANFIMN